MNTTLSERVFQGFFFFAAMLALIMTIVLPVLVS